MVYSASHSSASMSGCTLPAVNQRLACILAPPSYTLCALAPCSRWQQSLTCVGGVDISKDSRLVSPRFGTSNHWIKHVKVTVDSGCDLRLDLCEFGGRKWESFKVNMVSFQCMLCSRAGATLFVCGTVCTHLR